MVMRAKRGPDDHGPYHGVLGVCGHIHATEEETNDCDRNGPGELFTLYHWSYLVHLDDPKWYVFYKDLSAAAADVAWKCLAHRGDWQLRQGDKVVRSVGEEPPKPKERFWLTEEEMDDPIFMIE